jgi:hypothetical protein
LREHRKNNGICKPEKMPSGKATAIVQGRVVAEADHWEVVEGNIYVRLSGLSFFS